LAAKTNLADFEVNKSKVKGHSESIYGQISTLWVIGSHQNVCVALMCCSDLSPGSHDTHDIG